MRHFSDFVPELRAPAAPQAHTGAPGEPATAPFAYEKFLLCVYRAKLCAAHDPAFTAQLLRAWMSADG